MKICHLADTHLGAGGNHPRRGKSGLTLRQEDIINSFVEAVDKIIEIKPDVCIHAGDIFDSVRPLNKIITAAAEQLHRLGSDHKIPTIVITGNHDAPKQPHVGAALSIFRKLPNVYIAADSKLNIFEIGDTAFYALPHCLTTEILKEELTHCRPNSDIKHNVLILHGVAAGMPEFSMADLGEQELPLEMMAEFDYTALGHYHNVSQVGKRAWYSGSSERLSQSEREAAKGFLEVDLDPYNVKFHEVQCRVMVDLKPIDAEGKRGDELAKEIEKKVKELGSADKIVRIKIKNVTEETLKTMPTEIVNRLKHDSFSLNIAIEKKKTEESKLPQLGLKGLGQLDRGFIEYLETIDLPGFDKERLKREALKYLSSDES